MFHVGDLTADALNRLFQLFKINWLGQVVVKASLAAPRDIIFHPEAGKSDGRRFEAVLLTQSTNQFDSSSIGKADVADEQVKRLFGSH